jgi:hypothetical protein
MTKTNRLVPAVTGQEFASRLMGEIETGLTAGGMNVVALGVERVLASLSHEGRLQQQPKDLVAHCLDSTKLDSPVEPRSPASIT